MNYYPHHIGDYRSATLHLSDLEDLAYRRLLEMYYDTEKPIPADTQWVSRRIRLGLDVVETVLNDFFTLTENGFFHARCDMEIREYNIKAERSRLNGLKGGRRKANAGAAKNPAGSQQVTSSNPPATSGLANHEPVTMNHEPLNTLPKGKGDKSPLTTDEIIFGYGLPLLTNAGTSEKQARSFLGGLRKQHGDTALVDALRDCIREKPMQPLEWLAKVLPPIGAKSKPNKQQALEASNRALGRSWATSGEIINA